MDRKSSIENEPRTLGADQLQFAREAALYVIHSRSMEDALRVFTEGLEPVVGAQQRDEEGLRRARMESSGPRDIVSSLLSGRSEPSQFRLANPIQKDSPRL